MAKIFLIGAGKGGKAVLSRLLRFDWVEIVGVNDLRIDSPGIVLAKEAGLPVYVGDPFEMLAGRSVDMVFDLTGNPEIQRRLLEFTPRSFDVVTGQAAYLLWNVIQELEDREIQVMQYLGEHRILSEINLLLSKSETPDQIFDAIVLGGMRISGMPSGSLSIYNKDKNELFLVAAKGFSSSFYKEHAVYPVRPAGLTEHILSQSEPILIPSLSDYPAFNNPVLLKEGIRSLVAVPLLSERGPVGILYIDDFKPRTFNPSMVETLKLLATQAVIAIQKQQAFEQIRSLSIRDPLTGLYNRRYLNEIIIGEMERAYRLHQPLAVVLIDIDYFKAINDRFGHLIGDQVLSGLARLFALIIRPYDTLVRFGGEEFLVLMSQTDAQEALSVSERLRESVASERLLPEGVPVTCSFGISDLHREEHRLPTAEELIHCADKALYEAKRAGRNRVHVFRTDSAYEPR